MRIQTPLTALNNLARTQKMLSRALTRLSSGNRINQASDDASGLSIATGLESQIRGFNQSIRNINDASSVIQTAESTIGTQTNLVQRMRELAVQSSTGTLGVNDRNYLNTEFQALYSEYQRLTSQTNFNGLNLLDGTFATTNIQVGPESNDTIALSIASTQANQVFTKPVNTGSFNTASTSYATGIGPRLMLSGDLNGDHNSDIVTLNADGSISTLLGKSDGSFAAATTFSAGQDFEDAKLVDINGDGKLDLIAVDHGISTSPQVSVLLGTGTGSFTLSKTYAVGAGATSLAVGDINGDGKKDIVVGNEDTNTISVLLGAGMGIFTAGVTVASGNSPSVQLGDMNGDGKLDLVSANGVDGTLSVALGNGDGTFANFTNNTVGDEPITPQVADLNGDGKLDLVVVNSIDRSISLLAGNGNGTFQAQQTFATGSNSTSIQVVDLNADGQSDLVVPNGVDGTTSLLMNHAGNFSTSTVPTGINTRSAQAVTLGVSGVFSLLTADYYSNTLSVFAGNTQNVSAVLSMSISTQTQASNVLQVLSNALENLNQSRSQLGAFQSRLESAAEGSMVASQNLQQSRSLIMDTDYAAETAELAKAQILQQAGVSVLTQANVSNQLILQLLSFK